MLRAMDVVGNPSSVHAEGRAAKGIVETARGQVADLVGCEPSEVVFTSGATEAATSFIKASDQVMFPETAHDCILSNVGDVPPNFRMGSDGKGLVDLGPGYAVAFDKDERSLFVWSFANGETGVLDVDTMLADQFEHGRILEDAVQAYGKVSHTPNDFNAHYSLVSGHKFGGPKGAGAVFIRSGHEVQPIASGGGQEMGRRSGTENVIGIAGFGAAAAAAKRDLENGVWEQVEKLRDDLEDALASAASDITFFGKDGPRLPNTSCFAVPGWKGETQVMQMDLAGFAISAGSACSSGKVKESRVLKAMGFDSVTASSAIRVSMGPTTTEAEVMAFADTWIEHYRRWKQRAA